MKKFTRRLRRHHNTQTQEGAQPDAFFSQATASDHQIQTNGNAAFFQPKLEIDPVNSPSEKEADAAAEQVVNRPQSRDHSTQAVQRKKIQRMEEEQPAAKRIQRVEEEQPAAKRIQRVEEEQPAAKRIQRVEEEQPAAKRIQRKEEAQKEDAQAVETMIRQTKGGGVPLPEDLRAEMEKEFGADFSRVRIHTGADAIEMTQAMHAHAFTHGYDIYFNEGRFDPASKSGKELLAHELAHVVQQKGT